MSSRRHARDRARRSAALVALAGGAVALVILLLVVTVLVLRQAGGPDNEPVATGAASPGATGSVSPSTPAVSTPTASASTATPEASVVETPLPTPQPEDVQTLPAGLYCRDLNAQGFSYSASVDYWRLHGQPDRMDADRNGIPCETVYPAAEVEAYWPP